jgi:hypothetical protein
LVSHRVKFVLIILFLCLLIGKGFSGNVCQGELFNGELFNKKLSYLQSLRADNNQFAKMDTGGGEAIKKPALAGFFMSALKLAKTQQVLIFIILNSRARTNQVTVAVHVINAANRWPEFVRA